MLGPFFKIFLPLLLVSTALYFFVGPYAMLSLWLVLAVAWLVYLGVQSNKPPRPLD